MRGPFVLRARRIPARQQTYGPDLSRSSQRLVEARQRV